MARRRREGPDFVDLHVGGNVRMVRKDARLSLEGLAAALQISHQQLQKYETGSNRMSISMLFQIARELRVPVELFLEGLPAPRVVARIKPNQRVDWEQFLALPESSALVARYLALPMDVRESVNSLVTTIVAAVPSHDDVRRAQSGDVA